MKASTIWKGMRLFGLTKGRVMLFLGVAMASAGFDGFSMAMALPVLQFIEKGQDATALAATSRMWAAIVQAFALLGLPVTFLGLLLVILFLVLSRTVLTYIRQCYSVWLTQSIQHGIRTRLFEAFAHAEFRLFDGLSTGRIMNLTSNEAARAGGCVGSTLNMVIESVLITGLLMVLIWLNPAMTLLTVCVLGLGGWGVTHFVRRTRRISYELTDANANFSFLLAERLTGIRLLKLSAAVGRENDRLEKASAMMRENTFRIQKLNARVELFMDPVVTVLGLAILFISTTVFHMSLAEVGLFMLIMLRLLPLVKELLRSRQSLQGVYGGLVAVLEGLTQAREARERELGVGACFTGLAEGVRFSGVEFHYPGAANAALDGVNLFIPAGKITALVGPSGAGKSTLVDLLPRLRRHDAGRILLDGEPIESFELGSLRRGMAFVSQDSFILNDTVRNNLAFAWPDAGEQQILDALGKARAREFIASLPQGLDTILGERGVMLSGGQRQRLSLARALLQDAPLLILDEPTSALDSEVEKDIQEAIDGLRARGRTTIVIIAHRFSTIRDADKIVVLENGRVTQEGSHRELMVNMDWYARICSMQGSGLEDGENGK